MQSPLDESHLEAICEVLGSCTKQNVWAVILLPKSETCQFLRIEQRRNLREIVGKSDAITEFNHGVQ